MTKKEEILKKKLLLVIANHKFQNEIFKFINYIKEEIDTSEKIQDN